MLWITGDLHGSVDIGRLNTRRFPQQRQMTKEDLVLVCGDFGCVWSGDREDNYWLDWLERKPFTTLFLDGNHENFPLLEQFPEDIWSGGRIHRLRPSVLHLTRGQVFTLQRLRFFVMGGAASHDRAYRTEGKNWWPQELPGEEEFRQARAVLDAQGWKVDYVATHCAPDALQARLAPGYSQDRLTRFLQEIAEKLEYSGWFFGHYHQDCQLDAKHRALYEGWVTLP